MTKKEHSNLMRIINRASKMYPEQKKKAQAYISITASKEFKAMLKKFYEEFLGLYAFNIRRMHLRPEAGEYVVFIPFRSKEEYLAQVPEEDRARFDKALEC